MLLGLHTCLHLCLLMLNVFAQVALVGAPNVGKSSLVQLLSSGLPEVQNYPFTTRSIKMGHFYVAGRRHQVTGEDDMISGAWSTIQSSMSTHFTDCIMWPCIP